MLKADFHTHTKEDPHDYWIRHSAKELIEHAAKFGFNVLAITNHTQVLYSEELADFAMERGILLMPGIECYIEGKEVVVLNAPKEAEKLRTFSELREFKKKNPQIFVMAPHMFYPKGGCLQEDFFKHIDIFDGVEYSHYYCRGYNPYNIKAAEKALKHSKTIIGTSDAHRFFQFNNTYSFVDAEMDIDSVIQALKDNKIKISTKPLSYLNCARTLVPMIVHKLKDHWIKPAKSL